MDIYDPNIMGTAAHPDGASTPTTAVSEQPKTELDQNVEKLVGNISNWWSGFAKKSQDSINQARKEMESKGGIVNYAKSEYAKLETSIGEAQKKARDQSLATAPQTEDGQKEGATEPSVQPEGAQMERSETSKGKQRAVDDEAASEAAEGGNALSQGPTLGASVSSLFSKLTSDPRLVQLQHSLTSTLQSVSSSQGQKDADGVERAPGTNPIKLQESLSKLSLTIQSHLPHLDLKESQQLATRYLHATENFAKEIQSDMKDFVGELVRVVPPEGEAGSAEGNAAKAGDAEIKSENVQEKVAAPAEVATDKDAKSQAALPVTDAKATVPSVGTAAPAAEEEEEDFAWDEDDEEAAASTKGGPVATKKDERAPTAEAPAVNAKATVTTAAEETKPAQTKADESEEDSDWE